MIISASSVSHNSGHLGCSLQLTEVDQRFGTTCSGHTSSDPLATMSYSQTVKLHNVKNKYSRDDEISMYIRPRKTVIW